MLTIPLCARHFSYLDPVDRRIRALTTFLLLVIAILGAGSGTPISVSAQELPTALPEEVGMSSSRLDRLTGALQEYVNTNRIPGAVAMVLRDGRVVYHEAVGKLDIEADVPMGQDVIFRIASQTKALVSVAIMMLQEDGDLVDEWCAAGQPAQGRPQGRARRGAGVRAVEPLRAYRQGSHRALRRDALARHDGGQRAVPLLVSVGAFFRGRVCQVG